MKVPMWNRREPKETDLEMANVPESKWRVTLDAAKDSEAASAVSEYIRGLKENLEKGKGLLMYGPTRVGKSSLAACIVREVAAHRCEPYWIESFKAVDVWKEREKTEAFKLLHKAHCLILDDFGMEGDNPYPRQLIDHLLKYRLERERTTILTSNLEPEKIEKVYGVKTFALMKEFLIPIPVRGVDKKE